jgi:hypothetical protein
VISASLRQCGDTELEHEKSVAARLATFVIAFQPPF